MDRIKCKQILKDNTEGRQLFISRLNIQNYRKKDLVLQRYLPVIQYTNRTKVKDLILIYRVPFINNICLFQSIRSAKVQLVNTLHKQSLQMVTYVWSI